MQENLELHKQLITPVTRQKRNLPVSGAYGLKLKQVKTDIKKNRKDSFKKTDLYHLEEN